jgi:hypothetical protein
VIFAMKEAFLRALDTVWLRQPEAIRIRVPATLRRRVRRNLERSRALLRAAHDSEPGFSRDQLGRAALRGFLAVVGQACDPTCRDAHSAIGAGRTRVETTLRSEALREALSISADLEGAPSSDELRFRHLLELCDWTDALVDNRSERERTLRRWTPRVALALALLAGARITFGARNLAFGKPVSTSSICSRTPAPRYAEERLSRVVDGVHLEGPALGHNQWHTTAFAVCTDQEVHSWLSVDLGAERTLSQAVVYGRSDCCWLDDLPISVQLSSDNKRFETVATRTTPFTTEFPWKASLGGHRARYVRLYAGSDDKARIVISELEVYGH